MMAAHEESVTKDRIVTLARHRFLSEGFTRVSVDDITSELGMSKKTFYKFFASKEDLVSQIVERLMGEIRITMDHIVDREGDFIEKLHELLLFLGRTISEFHKPFQQDIARHLPGLWQRVQAFRTDRINTNINRLLDQGVTAGYLRPDINRQIFLRTYLAAVDGIVTPSVLSNESFSAREAMEGIVKILFQGVLTEDASRLLGELRHRHLPHSS